VTIVIPCYNHGHYLRDAIHSAQQQNYPALEVLVVDDGSTDESAAIAASAGAAVVSQRNSGLAAARNAGLMAAHGEFVVFLDADDELLPDAIDRGATLLRARPELACVVRRSQVMDAARRPLPVTYAPVDTGDLYGEWLRQNFAWTPGAAMFRRERLIAAGGFPSDVPAAADYAVYLTLARNGAVAYDPIDVVRYRQHDDNMSRDPVLMLDATLRVLRREERSLPDRYRKAYREALAYWRLYYGDQIVDRMRANRRAGVMGAWDARAAIVLASKCPYVLVRHLARKFARILGGIGRRPTNAASASTAPAPERMSDAPR
jgi:glycosyltransferase involved in cell wall biosynthesis